MKESDANSADFITRIAHDTPGAANLECNNAELIEGVPALTSTPILRRRMPELDSLRGIAILMVLFYHGFYWSTGPQGPQGLSGLSRYFVEITRAGTLGVNLFFVLSGFLITGILWQSKPDPHYFRNFYTRRALRILPVLYALLVLLILVGDPDRTYLLLSFLFLSNVTPLLGVPVGYTVLWSLSVEEHFYLVWPAVVRKLSRVSLMKTLLAIILLEPVARGLCFAFGGEGISSYTWLVADGLAVGASLALYVHSPRFSRVGLAKVCGGLIAVASVMLLLGAPYGILTRRSLLGGELQLTGANLLFGGLLGTALLVGTGPYGFLTRPWGLGFFGNISYGLYLIHQLAFNCYDQVVKSHWPALASRMGRFNLMTMRFVIASTVAIVVSVLSRYYFEESFLRLKDRFAAPGPRIDVREKALR